MTYDLSGWARHNHAFNDDTKQTLAPTLSDDAVGLYRRIDWNGNYGWHDAPGKRDVLRDLRRLKELGEYDGADLVGYLIGRHSNRALRALLALADRAREASGTNRDATRQSNRTRPLARPTE